ncbi:hypothetical protein ACFYOV_17260 [Streptomyces sp. NPDC005931]|uniref:hypothetical protein n=1 Tax=Streptomyces sp. NPDC005931 TaxID=3364737 RepID=UPI00367991BA
MLRSSPWRAALAATAVTFIAAVPLASAQSAYADAPTSAYQPYPPELSSTTVPAGGVIFFSAGGFEPGEEVTAALVPQSSVVVSRASSGGGDGKGWPHGIQCGPVYRANENGTVIGCFVVPKNTPPGPYLFTLTGEESGSVSAPVTVTAGNGKGDGGKGDGPDRARSEGNGELDRQASLVLKQGIPSGPGTATVTGNGKTLSLRAVDTQGRPVAPGDAQTGQVALAGYDAAGRNATATGSTDSGSETNWAVAGGAAAFAAVAVKAVTVVRRRRTRAEQG